MAYAEVSVNSPAVSQPTFSYRIPENMDIAVGQAIWVPFGKQQLQGIVVTVDNVPQFPQTRDIIGAVNPPVKLSAVCLKLGKWISTYYRCQLFQALALMLPPGFERKTITYIRLSSKDDNSINRSQFSSEEQLVISQLKNESRFKLKDIEKLLGTSQARRTVKKLTDEGIITQEFQLQPSVAKPKLILHIQSVADKQRLSKAIDDLKNKAPKQAAALKYLLATSEPVEWARLKQISGVTRSSLQTLIEKGYIEASHIETLRGRGRTKNLLPESPFPPGQDQARAIDEIKNGLQNKQSSLFLLCGVTASGKTEVYLQSAAHAINMGKTVIVLVPEISLTQFTIDRFDSRFPGQVTVLHSRLSPGEQFDQWREIESGKYNIVIGPRSALFSPLSNLGLVIIDEEHEWSYKQENTPRYHAREVAISLCELRQATLVLGSATPDVESYYKAVNGKYTLLTMPKRIQYSKLPTVEIVDLRQELKSGNRSIFSQILTTSITETLNEGGQIILFLNRRGGATFVQCRDCGYVVKCRKCAVPLTQHYDQDRMVCHHCSYRRMVPVKCPQCQSSRIKYLGLGTQLVAAEVEKLFPSAKTVRWDSDSTRGKNSHNEFMQTFQARQADILIGTQMIAKGFHFPAVNLVGVVNADTGLNFPDFRAGERTFSLLSQVAGRAGRGSAPGKVIIQTYQLNHYVIQALGTLNYQNFYNQEIKYRQQLNQPPFSKIIRLTFGHRNKDEAQNKALWMKNQLARQIETKGLLNLFIIGPAPAYIYRKRGYYRWSIYIRGQNPHLLLDMIELCGNWNVDVDPYGIE